MSGTLLFRGSVVVALPYLAGCSLILPLGPEYSFTGDAGHDSMDASSTRDAGEELDAGNPSRDAGADAGPCVAADETCNLLDDDCDGRADESPSECAASGALTACVGGGCQVTGCEAGLDDCDDTPDCETDVSRSRYLCGTCGGSCSAAQELCNDDGCVPAAPLWGTVVRTARSHLSSVVGDDSGVLIAAGWFEGIGSINGDVVDSLSGRDSFVISLHPETGATDWLVTYGATDHVAAVDAAMAGSHLYVAGNHQEAFDVGTETVAVGSGTSSAHLVRFTPDGSVHWVHSFTTTPPLGSSTSQVSVGRVVADSRGNSYLTLQFVGRLERSGMFAATTDACMTHVTSLDPDGDVRFVTNLEGCDLSRDVGIDPTEGEIHLVGYADGSTVVDGVTYGPDLHGIRVVLSASDGAFLRTFVNGRRMRIDESACDDEEGYWSVAFDPRSIGGPFVYMGIYCPGNIDLGLGPPPGTGGIIAAYQGAGEVVQGNWRLAPGAQTPRVLEFGGDGRLVAGGDTRLVADFGLGTLGVSGLLDGFLAAYHPDGTIEWATTFGGDGSDVVTSVFVRGDGSVFAGGDFEDTFSFGSVTFEGSPASEDRAMIFRMNNL